MTQEEIKRLRAHLTSEDRKHLADLFECSYRHINNVLSHPRSKRDERIILAAAKLVKEHFLEVQELTEFIKSI